MERHGKHVACVQYHVKERGCLNEVISVCEVMSRALFCVAAKSTYNMMR